MDPGKFWSDLDAEVLVGSGSYGWNWIREFWSDPDLVVLAGSGKFYSVLDAEVMVGSGFGSFGRFRIRMSEKGRCPIRISKKCWIRSGHPDLKFL